MKNLFYLLVCCSFLLSCDNDKQEWDYPEWAVKELNSSYTFGLLYSIEQDGSLYYGLHEMFDSSMTMTLRLFNENGTEIKEEDEMHAKLTELFIEGKFTAFPIYEDPSSM